ncbi:hypothetical protein [Salibacterium aidingense]|uniref:hypothetical protein n=1 Tax=Salibacterium aidingense TaxID=384933 RepID=UPI0004226259|nr:hypothetical protein [Salibacterium aidingense]
MIEQSFSIRHELERKILEAPVYTNNVGQAYYKVTPATLYSVLDALEGSAYIDESTAAETAELWSMDLQKRAYFRELAQRSALKHRHTQAIKAYEQSI